MKILIKNAALISMDEKRDRIEKEVCILIEEDKIIEIGKEINNTDIDKEIDATGKVVLPGLINTHSHVPMSIFRETIDGLKLQEWLEDRIWPMEAKLVEDDIYYTSLLSFIEMIKTGCTTINDMYFMADSIIKARDTAGIRLQTTRTLMSINSKEDSIQRVEDLKELIQRYSEHDDTLSFNFGIHGLYTSDEEYVKQCIKTSKELNLPLHMHFCENKKEVDDIKSSYQKSPVQVLLDDFNDVHTILAHCVKIEEDEIQKIKDLDIHISTCPISNLKLGCGVPKIAKMLDCGINVSLGTDGQGSGSSLDMFEVMKFTALLQKGIQENPTLMTSYDVLKMATINGARALCLEDKIGTITVGKKADLIILDLEDVILKPTNDLISEIVYNAKGTNVDTTIVNGKILMENKKLNLDIDEKLLIKKCEKIIERIKI